MFEALSAVEEEPLHVLQRYNKEVDLLEEKLRKIKNA